MATLLALASAPTLAHARPIITVGESIPFSARDLGDAVRLRADSNARIHVDRRGEVFVITVDDQVRDVDLVLIDDPHDAARIVALVIVALVEPAAPLPPGPIPAIAPPAPPDAPDAPEPPDPPEAPDPPDPPGSPVAAPLEPSTAAPGSAVLFAFGSPQVHAPPKNWTFRAAIGYRFADGYETPSVAATLSRRLGPSAHLVAGVSYDEQRSDAPVAWNEGDKAVSGRLGVELRHRWIAFEAGAIATRFDVCGWGTTASGGYAALRTYLVPVGGVENRLYFEAGGRRTSHTATCDDGENVMMTSATELSGHAVMGLEVPL